jgi:hypothetical protein
LSENVRRREQLTGLIADGGIILKGILKNWNEEWKDCTDFAHGKDHEQSVVKRVINFWVP